MRRWGQTTPRGISAVESHKIPVIKLSQNKGEQTIISQQDNLKIEKEKYPSYKHKDNKNTTINRRTGENRRPSTDI